MWMNNTLILYYMSLLLLRYNFLFWRQTFFVQFECVMPWSLTQYTAILLSCSVLCLLADMHVLNPIEKHMVKTSGITPYLEHFAFCKKHHWPKKRHKYPANQKTLYVGSFISYYRLKSNILPQNNAMQCNKNAIKKAMKNATKNMVFFQKKMLCVKPA